VVLARQDNWLYVYLQFDPLWARPPELMRDVRIRRGLLHAMDREAIREFALPGFPYTNGDTFVPSNDPRAGDAGEPFSRYRFDPARAIAELAEAGWRRSADGRLLTLEGRQPQVEVRGATTTWVKEVALIADFWRRLGIDAPEVIPSEAVARDREWQATFPATTVRARGSAEDIFVVFDGRLQATSQNRWQGANYGHYANPALEQLLDQLWSTLDTRGQGELLRQMGEILATDLPALPVYFRTTFAVVRKGIHTLQDDYAATQDLGAMARGAHLWYRD
jgi:peptide/nickel transport system substrate-binding protein